MFPGRAHAGNVIGRVNRLTLEYRDHGASVAAGSDGEREETVYRLCGNSIPINMLADVVAHAVALIKPQVKESIAAALAEHEKARARS